MLAVEKKSVAQLQEERTVRKLCLLDDHVAMAFAGTYLQFLNRSFDLHLDISSGLTADARVIIDRARVECQSHKLTVEDPVTMEYITRFIAQIKQKYTQSNGRRPFGISCLIAGFDDDGSSRLFQTDPSGVYHEWKANATGRSAKTVKEYLEKNFSDEVAADNDKTIKLAIRALLEVVQGKNLEVALLRRGLPMSLLPEEELTKYVTEVEREKEEEAEKKKAKK